MVDKFLEAFVGSYRRFRGASGKAHLADVGTEDSVLGLGLELLDLPVGHILVLVLCDTRFDAV